MLKETGAGGKTEYFVKNAPEELAGHSGNYGNHDQDASESESCSIYFIHHVSYGVMRTRHCSQD